MTIDDLSPVKCPLCGHTPCVVLGIDSDQKVEGSESNRPRPPKVFARCAKCGAEFELTRIGR